MAASSRSFLAGWSTSTHSKTHSTKSSPCTTTWTEKALIDGLLLTKSRERTAPYTLTCLWAHPNMTFQWRFLRYDRAHRLSLPHLGEAGRRGDGCRLYSRGSEARPPCFAEV